MMIELIKNKMNKNLVNHIVSQAKKQKKTKKKHTQPLSCTYNAHLPILLCKTYLVCHNKQSNKMQTPITAISMSPKGKNNKITQGPVPALYVNLHLH